MKLEFLADGAEETPLIRLFNFDSLEAQKLRDMFEGFVKRRNGTFQLDKAEFIISLSNCRLGFEIGNADKGISSLAKDNDFHCILTVPTYERIIGLLEPFCQGSAKPDAYQWLNETGKVALLLSPSGKW